MLEDRDENTLSFGYDAYENKYVIMGPYTGNFSIHIDEYPFYMAIEADDGLVALIRVLDKGDYPDTFLTTEDAEKVDTNQGWHYVYKKRVETCRLSRISQLDYNLNRHQYAFKDDIAEPKEEMSFEEQTRAWLGFGDIVSNSAVSINIPITDSRALILYQQMLRDTKFKDFKLYFTHDGLRAVNLKIEDITSVLLKKDKILIEYIRDFDSEVSPTPEYINGWNELVLICRQSVHAFINNMEF